MPPPTCLEDNQSGAFFSVQVPSFQTILACAKLTKTRAESLPFPCSPTPGRSRFFRMKSEPNHSSNLLVKTRHSLLSRSMLPSGLTSFPNQLCTLLPCTFAYAVSPFSNLPLQVTAVPPTKSILASRTIPSSSFSKPSPARTMLIYYCPL